MKFHFQISLPNHLSSIPTLPAFTRALKHHLCSMPCLRFACDASACARFINCYCHCHDVIYSSLLTTLTVVQILTRSNQLNVSHFVIQSQLLPSYSPEIPYCPSKCVPLERLRLVEVIHFA